MWVILLDNGEQYWIRRDDLPNTSFAEGSSYDPEQFQQQIRLCQYPHALNHAVSMLARRPCSKKEISSRLVRLRYTEEVAGLVVYKLEKEKLLDDEAFCEQWIRYRLSGQIGISAIIRELKIKGIDNELIQKSLEGIDPEKERENAVSAARRAWKRFGSETDRRKSRQKVISSLVRKGYDWDTAHSACETAEKDA